MNRRQLLKFGGGLLAAAHFTPSAAAEGHVVAYTRGVFDAALASGKPFMLDFHASW